MNRFLLFSGLFLLCSCGVSDEDGFTGEGIGPDGGSDTDGSNVNNPESEVCQKMDILFVIDDSGSMAEEQSNLAANFPQFINVLNNFDADGGVLDYRVAVTTTGRDVAYTVDPSMGLPFPSPFPPIPMSESGDNGAMRQECGMSQRWLDRNDANVADTFSCVAQVGTNGPSLEMPLYTTQLALSDRMADLTNDGFLREDSLLGIVILTDEDDCSRTDNNFTIGNDQCGQGNPDYMPVSSTVQFLDDLTGDRSRWATAVIAGPTGCSSGFGDATEAANLKDFVSQTGDNAVFSSICDGDLSTPLQQALETFDAACRGFEPID